MSDQIGKQEYLGDGVYVEWNGFHFVLKANNPYNPTDTIYLETVVLSSLLAFANRVLGSEEFDE